MAKKNKTEEPSYKYLSDETIAKYQTMDAEAIKAEIQRLVAKSIENDANEKADLHVKECKEALKEAREQYTETRGACKEALGLLNELGSQRA